MSVTLNTTWGNVTINNGKVVDGGPEDQKNVNNFTGSGLTIVKAPPLGSTLRAQLGLGS